DELQRAVIAGEFERDGRSRVLYLHPAVTSAKMTREKMRNAVETFLPETVRRQYLACCWLPTELATAWCLKNNITVDGSLETAHRQSRQAIDDNEAVADGVLLVRQQRLSFRHAAEQIAATHDLRGNSAEAIVERLRRKISSAMKK